MKYSFKILFIITIGILFYSCKKKDKNIEYLEVIVDQTIGKKLNIPNNLKMLSLFSEHKIDSSEIASAEFKIYTRLNASCESCFSTIKLWNDLALELNKVPIVIICNSQDDFENFKFFIQYETAKKFIYPFFLDIDNKFLTMNKFMNDIEQFETVLTNKQNKILLMGNPLTSKNIKNLYISEIEKN